MSATPEQKQAFAELVRGWSFEQCADMLRTIDRKQSEQADWIREILHVRFPELAYNPNPNRWAQTVYLDSAADRQRIDTLERELAAMQAALNAAQFTPHGTPVFKEQPTSDYTAVQKFGFMVGVGSLATWAVAEFAGPAIIEAFSVLLNYTLYGLGCAIGCAALYFVFKPAEQAADGMPMDSTIIINQTVYINDNRKNHIP